MYLLCPPPSSFFYTPFAYNRLLQNLKSRFQQTNQHPPVTCHHLRHLSYPHNQCSAYIQMFARTTDTPTQTRPSVPVRFLSVFPVQVVASRSVSPPHTTPLLFFLSPHVWISTQIFVSSSVFFQGFPAILFPIFHQPLLIHTRPKIKINNNNKNIVDIDSQSRTILPTLSLDSHFVVTKLTSITFAPLLPNTNIVLLWKILIRRTSHVFPRLMFLQICFCTTLVYSTPVCANGGPCIMQYEPLWQKQNDNRKINNRDLTIISLQKWRFEKIGKIYFNSFSENTRAIGTHYLNIFMLGKLHPATQMPIHNCDSNYNVGHDCTLCARGIGKRNSFNCDYLDDTLLFRQGTWTVPKIYITRFK